MVDNSTSSLTLFFLVIQGVGDYLAMSYSRSKELWTPADPEYYWVYSWDGHNEFWDGRITNYEKKYPNGLVGDVHIDGQIWSTCNMKIWDAIGREASDKIHLVSTEFRLFVTDHKNILFFYFTLQQYVILCRLVYHIRVVTQIKMIWLMQ